MDDEPSAPERLKRAEVVIAELREHGPSSATRLPLAEALLEMAEALEELAEMPPVPGSAELERALGCVSEIADEIGAAGDSSLDDLVFEALNSRLRLLVMLGRPDETASTTAAIRARVGGEKQQLERAERLHAEASEAYSRIEQYPEAVHAALNAVEQLGAPYAEESPAPPPAVVPYLMAGFSLMARIAIYHGQPDAAKAILEEGLNRFGNYTDATARAELDHARQLLKELNGGPQAR